MRFSLFLDESCIHGPFASGLLPWTLTMGLKCMNLYQHSLEVRELIYQCSCPLLNLVRRALRFDSSF